jgi:hypothetical protein
VWVLERTSPVIGLSGLGGVLLPNWRKANVKIASIPMRISGLVDTAAWASATLFLCGWLAQASRNETSAATVTDIKLEEFGWQQPLRAKPGEIDSLPSQRVTIDSRGRVLASFTVRMEGDGLVERAKPGLSLRVVRFAADGKPDLSLTLPTNNWNGNGVYLDDRDQIIVRANDQVQILIAAPKSNDDQAGWKAWAPCGPHCEVFQSLDRRTLYLDTWDADPQIAVLNTENPSDIKRCRMPRGVEPQSITDDLAYFNHDLGGPSKPRPVLYRWPLCDYTRRMELPVLGHSRVLSVSDDLLLLGNDLYGADGKLRLRIAVKLTEHEVAGTSGIEGISENGGRVALTAATWRGGHPALDIGDHMTAERVIVYDIVKGEQLATIPIHPLNFALHPAISPDGHRVAALANDTLTIGDVP